MKRAVLIAGAVLVVALAFVAMSEAYRGEDRIFLPGRLERGLRAEPPGFWDRPYWNKHDRRYLETRKLMQKLRRYLPTEEEDYEEEDGKVVVNVGCGEGV